MLDISGIKETFLVNNTEASLANSGMKWRWLSASASPATAVFAMASDSTAGSALADSGKKSWGLSGK